MQISTKMHFAFQAHFTHYANDSIVHFNFQIMYAKSKDKWTFCNLSEPNVLINATVLQTKSVHWTTRSTLHYLYSDPTY